MQYQNAKYLKDFNGNNACISVEISGVQSVVPLDPANTDYANIMQLVAEGKLTIALAE
ncbi:hypothetical protein [Caudoviricetes sp.]|nr:hypothetical protein [Caudoviricetes sp.]